LKVQDGLQNDLKRKLKPRKTPANNLGVGRSIGRNSGKNLSKSVVKCRGASKGDAIVEEGQQTQAPPKKRKRLKSEGGETNDRPGSWAEIIFKKKYLKVGHL